MGAKQQSIYFPHEVAVKSIGYWLEFSETHPLSGEKKPRMYLSTSLKGKAEDALAAMDMKPPQALTQAYFRNMEVFQTISTTE